MLVAVHDCPQVRAQMEKMLAAHVDDDSLLASHEPAATEDISELPTFDPGSRLVRSQPIQRVSE